MAKGKQQMRGRIYRLWVAALLAGVLTGCGLTAGGLNKSTGQSGGVLTGAAPLDMSSIQTQTLDPAAIGSAPATGRVIGAPVPQSSIAPPIANTPSADSAAPTPADIGAAAKAALQKGGGQTGQQAAGGDTLPSAATKVQPQPSSPEEAACLNQGGRWGRAGNTSAMACFRPAKDAGKSCNIESDCTSQCLARSRSCAPFWPIFGCTEVIQNNGAVVNLCLE